MQRQRAGQPVDEIEQVHPLIDQLAAAGTLRIGAPFAIVSGPPAVTVASADVHQLSMVSRMDFCGQLRQPRVEPVIEANLHDPAVCRRDP
jgi:hypothetical protein